MISAALEHLLSSPDLYPLELDFRARRITFAPMSRAAAALGADGLMVEVHPCPERALSDGPQSLDLPGFSSLMRSLTEPLRALEM